MRVISQQSFEILTPFLWTIYEYRNGKYCCRFVFYNNMHSFWRPFPMKFLGKSRGRKRKRKKLRHLHVLSMVYTRKDHSSWPISARKIALLLQNVYQHIATKGYTINSVFSWSQLRSSPRGIHNCMMRHLHGMTRNRHPMHWYSNRTTWDNVAKITRMQAAAGSNPIRTISIHCKTRKRFWFFSVGSIPSDI